MTMEEHAAVDSHSVLADYPQSRLMYDQEMAVVSSAMAASAGRAARRAVDRMVRGSNLFSSGMGDDDYGGNTIDDATITRSIDPSDLIVGNHLGQGGFSNVREAKLASEADCKPQPHYAVKYLHNMAMGNKKKYQRGAADLIIEAKILEAMSHRNIIKLHGVTAGDVAVNFGTGRPAGFFLLLDQLSSTLERRIALWANLDAKYSKFVVFRRATHDFRGCGRRSLLTERLGVACDLADALSYLHGRGVAFRDIKPDNIGFDERNVLKLFDFGLANELKPSSLLPDGTYRLTGNTGSRRYMAPEVAKNMPYDLSVDAYSFGVLLWEMWATEKPFNGYSVSEYMECVVEGGHRPCVDPPGVHALWPSRIKDLMIRCWSKEARSRPDFVSILETLISIKEEEDSTRKHSFRGLSLLGGIKAVKPVSLKSPQKRRWLKSSEGLR